MRTNVILFYAASIATGALVGTIARPVQPVYDQDKTVPSTKPISYALPAVKESLQHSTEHQLSREDMNQEVEKSGAIDRRFALFAFYGGSRKLQEKAEESARRLSYGKYNNYRREESKYHAASSESEQREAYRELSEARLAGLFYLYELSRQEQLIARPKEVSGPEPSKPHHVK
jgi:hypothetical protein